MSEKPNDGDKKLCGLVTGFSHGGNVLSCWACDIIAQRRVEIAAEVRREALEDAKAWLVVNAKWTAIDADALPRALATRRSQADNELEDAVLECSAAATAEAEEVRRETLQQAADVCSPEVEDWCDCRKKVLALMAHQHRFVTDEDGAVHPCACGEAYK